MESYVLFVDDEPSILSAIKRVFRKTPHKVLTADTIEKALDLIASKSIAVLVSDYTMPGRTGAELLAAAKEIRPDMIRIILSGNGDQDATIQSINKGAASRFLTKPWNDSELVQEIDQAVQDWKKSKYFHIEKKLLNQAAFVGAADMVLSHAQNKRHAIVYFGVRDFEGMQRRISPQKVSEFLQFLTPLDRTLDSCMALGLLDDYKFCCVLAIPESAEVLELEIANLISLFSGTFIFDNQKYQVSIEAGYCLSDAECNSVVPLIANAVTAYQQARLDGKGTVVGFKPEMLEQKKHQQIMENCLQDAHEENEFILHYQPKINALNGSMHGAEALVRWNSKAIGMVPPNDFIPLAERDDTILDLGHWVMEEAARQWMLWFGNTEPQPTISVNVSPKQLEDPQFVKRLENVLTTTGIDPSKFELEITESLMMENVNATVDVLNEIKKLGVMLSIDDFGTGFSSLSHLNLLPVDTLKIDRSFIFPMQESKESRNLVRNLIKLGHDLGVDIVAEGVEEEKQLNILKAYGCDVIQGYYYSAPVPADEYLKLIEKYQPSSEKSGDPTFLKAS